MAEPFVYEEETAEMHNMTWQDWRDKDLSKADTSFMYMATALTQLMTPGLALFYGGLVGADSVVSIMFQSLICMSVVFSLWVLCGFSLTFGDPMLAVAGYRLCGSPATFFFWRDVHIYKPLQRAGSVIVPGFPGMLFAAYQGMFAVISPAIISGAFADRLRFRPYVVFVILWVIVVYCPLGHMNWGGGLMFQMGGWDFAGGVVVHESAGFAALAAILVLGRRVPRDHEHQVHMRRPHNIPLVVIGTCLLWFGWFGFNGGSALTIGGLAGIAFVNTQIGPAASMATWVFIDLCRDGKPKLIGACCGALAGMVVITPMAGFVQPANAFLAGIVGALVCYTFVYLVERYDFDDAVDTVGVHGAGGLLGMILVGVLADPEICSNRASAPEWCANPATVTRSLRQTLIQTCCGLAGAVWSFVGTYVLLKVMIQIGLTPILNELHQQETAQDIPQHGELGYHGSPFHKHEKLSTVDPDSSGEEDSSQDGRRFCHILQSRKGTA